MKDRVYTEDMGAPPQDIDGGSASPSPRKPPMKRAAPPMKRAAPKGSGMFREGMPVPQDIDGGSASPKKYAKGGSVSSRADGIAQRGKTNCKMV